MHKPNSIGIRFMGVVVAWGALACTEDASAQVQAARPAVNKEAVALSPQPLPPKENAVPVKRPGLNKDATALSPQPLPPKENAVPVKRPGLNKDATALSPQPLPPKELPAKPPR